MGQSARPDLADNWRMGAINSGLAASAAAVLAVAAFLGTSLLGTSLLGPAHAPVALALDPDPILEYLNTVAAANGKVVTTSGSVVSVQDPADDAAGFQGTLNDITQGGHAWMDMVPSWLLDGPFRCDGDNIVCSSFGSDAAAFGMGAVLMHERLNGRIAADPGKRLEWGVLAHLDQFPVAPFDPNRPDAAFGAVSHGWIVRLEEDASDILLFVYSNGQFGSFRTHARAAWVENDLFLLIPFEKEWVSPLGWDLYAFCSDGTEAGTGRDRLDPLPWDSVLGYTPGLGLEFSEAPPSDEPGPSVEPGSSVESGPSDEPGPSASEPDGGGGVGGFIGPLLQPIVLVLGIALVLILLWLMFGRRRRRAPEAGSKPPPEPPPEPPPGD